MIRLSDTVPAYASLFSKPAASKARMRLLILPDWQGGQTDYIKRMAQLFGDSLGAETWILHPYDIRQHPRDYEQQGRSAVQGLLSDRTQTRQWISDFNNAMQEHWCSPSLPLVYLGFCFGGTLAFEAARTLPELTAAISIHGDPGTELALPVESHESAMILLNGGSDPLIKEQNLALFETEMKQTPREWFQFALGKARHSFTKKEVGNIGPGSIFDQRFLRMSVDLVSATLPSVLAYY